MKNLRFLFIAFMCPLYVIGQNIVVEGGIKADSLDIQSGLIKNVANPVSPQDAATKAYVDAIKESLNEDLLNTGLSGFVEDIDGNKYKTIKIGDQVWMTENLKTTKYNDGTPISNVSDTTAWINLTTPALCWHSNDSLLTAQIYGALYNYYTVADTNSLNVCPTGWHIPTDVEWSILTDSLIARGYGYGFEESGSDIGKSVASTFGWTTHGLEANVGNDPGSNNSAGFSGLPGGYRLPTDGTFYNVGNFGFWWSSTERNTATAWRRLLNYSDSEVGYGNSLKGYGFSVRCLRD